MTDMMKRISTAIVAALAACGSITAQENRTPEGTEAPTPIFRLGLYGGFGYNMHETNASIFSGGGDCGAFSDGTGSGPVFGLFGEFPLLDGMLDLTTALNFAQRGGAFGEAFTAGLPVLDPNSNQYVPLERRHDYTADLGLLLVDFGVRVSPIKNIPIYLRAAGSAGFPLTEASYHQTEQILSPSGVRYPETRTTERDVAQGPIRDVQTLVAATGALGYSLPIGPRLSIAPEVSFYYPFTDVTLAYRWRISSAQVGVAVRYGFLPPPPPAPGSEPESDPESSTRPTLASSPEASPSAMLATASSEKVEVVRTIVTETFPILPYIFFDSAATDIPTRYRRTTGSARDSFDELLLPHRSLDAYYDILNIVGNRLAKHPDTRITLNGTTDGQEEPIVGTANNLARTRAQSVKDYLMRVWEIDPARMTVTTSTRPTYPSSMQYAEGAEENRRVEIISNDDVILQPIIHEKFNEYSYRPKRIEFNAEAASTSPVESWKLTVNAGSKTVHQRSGQGNPPGSITWTLDDNAAAGIVESLPSTEGLACTLDVVDERGKRGRAEFKVPASQSTHPFEVSRLSLIVFDFDKSAISQQNRRMITTFVSESVTPSSTSKITGSTDRLGELAHNQELSQARAESVRDLIMGQRPDAVITGTQGVGPSRLLYDNNVPEGRYYCRTVTVEVETPIEGSHLQ